MEVQNVQDQHKQRLQTNGSAVFGQEFTDLSLAHLFAHSLILPLSILLPFRSKCFRINDQDPAL